MTEANTAKYWKREANLKECTILGLRAEVERLEDQLAKTRNSWTVQQDLLQDACNAHAQAAHDRDRYREVLENITGMVNAHLMRELAQDTLNRK